MQRHDQLLEKLSSAECGSRELDALIAAELQIVPLFFRTHYPKCKQFRFHPEENGYVTVLGSEAGHDWNPIHRRAAPRYTSSIDAALTLLPPDPTNENTGKADWRVENTNGGVTPNAQVGKYVAHAETPELSLCLAALRMRFDTKTLRRPKKVSRAV